MSLRGKKIPQCIPTLVKNSRQVSPLLIRKAEVNRDGDALLKT